MKSLLLATVAGIVISTTPTLASAQGQAGPATAIPAPTEPDPPAASPASPTPTPAPPPDARPSDIVVTGERPGDILSDTPVDEVLSEADIASYGASNALDLVGQLAARTNSGGGRGSGFPIVLVEGRRIASFGEIRNIPPEAIERLEIFPPEAAIAYGYAPDQRVINFHLKDNFAAVTSEVQGSGSTFGDRWTGSGEASLFRVIGKSRLNLTARAGYTGPLSEFDRGIIQASGDPADGRLRTLLPETAGLHLDGTFARPLSDAIGATLNLTYDRGEARSLLGPSLVNPSVALRATSNGSSFHSGLSSDGRIGEWRWSLTGNFDRTSARVTSERSDPLGGTIALIDRTRQVNQNNFINATFNGALFELPAGPVQSTVQVGAGSITNNSRSERNGQLVAIALSRETAEGSININTPIADRDRETLSFLGNLSVNARYAYRTTSDFDTITNWTAGMNWTPLSRFDLIATWKGEQNPPDLARVGAPVLVTPLRSIYDFARGETVLADVISGGNAALRAETRRDFRAQANWRPIEGKELLLTASYARVRSRNTTADFPLLTPEIEAAFPGRVTRDSTGRIISVDQRPVNFEATRGRQIRYGISFSRQFGTPQGGGGGGAGGGNGPPRTGGGPAGGGFGRMFGGPGSGGRWSIAAYHTVRLQDEVVIHSGVPMLDLLNGSATGGSGGAARHEVEFDGGWFFKGVGLRANGTWRAGTRVIGGPTPGGTASDLDFSPVMTVNLRGFIDINQQTAFVAAHPVFRNTRIRVAIDNLFADTQEVRDANGLVPLSYQDGYLNPAGRVIELSLRKQF